MTPEERQKIYRKVRTAIENGHITRPDTCDRCGTKPGPAIDGRTKIHAHHDNHNEPLEVTWLCASCHNSTSRDLKIPNPASFGGRKPKCCCRCKKWYPATNEFFHAERRKPDGLRTLCKKCQKKANDEFKQRPNAIETRRAYGRLTHMRAKKKLSTKKWLSKNPGYQTKRSNKWRKNNRDKARAHNKVWTEILAGRLTQQPCEQCGTEKAHAHHDDYSKPLDIRWLCPACHGIEHQYDIADAIEKEMG